MFERLFQTLFERLFEKLSHSVFMTVGVIKVLPGVDLKVMLGKFKENLKLERAIFLEVTDWIL